MTKKDFWKTFKESDKEELSKIYMKMTNNMSRMKDIKKWFDSNKEELLESYVMAIVNLEAEAWTISFNIYGSFLYIACNKERLKKEVEPVEPIPQSTNLQKELDTIYTKTNIEKAIEELGVFTEPDEKE